MRILAMCISEMNANYSHRFFSCPRTLRIHPDNEDFIDMGRFPNIIDRTTADPKLV